MSYRPGDRPGNIADFFDCSLMSESNEAGRFQTRIEQFITKPLISFGITAKDTHGKYSDVKTIQVGEAADEERVFPLKVGLRPSG